MGWGSTSAEREFLFTFAETTVFNWSFFAQILYHKVTRHRISCVKQKLSRCHCSNVVRCIYISMTRQIIQSSKMESAKVNIVRTIQMEEAMLIAVTAADLFKSSKIRAPRMLLASHLSALPAAHYHRFTHEWPVIPSGSPNMFGQIHNIKSEMCEIKQYLTRLLETIRLYFIWRCILFSLSSLNPIIISIKETFY